MIIMNFQCIKYKLLYFDDFLTEYSLTYGVLTVKIRQYKEDLCYGSEFGK